MTSTAVITRPVLTLAMKEEIRQQDVRFGGEPGKSWWCGDCLEDLPADPWLHGSHVCGETVTVERAFGGLSPESIDPAPGEVACAPEPAAGHKTRTTQPNGYVQDADGCRRFDKRGRVMRDKFSYAFCSCGWTGAGATRAEARSAARAHRHESQEG